MWSVSVLLTLLALSLACCDGSQLAVIWLLCGQTHVANIWGSLWPTANEEMRPSVPQHGMCWILPTTTGGNLEADPPPVGPAGETGTLANTWSERQWATGARITTPKFPTHRNCEIRRCLKWPSWEGKTDMKWGKWEQSGYKRTNWNFEENLNVWWQTRTHEDQLELESAFFGF